jgi:hypothetical protein
MRPRQNARDCLSYSGDQIPFNAAEAPQAVMTGTNSTPDEIQTTGKDPPRATEAAIIATLPPGNYTAIVTGVANTTGIGLVEVYALP